LNLKRIIPAKETSKGGTSPPPYFDPGVRFGSGILTKMQLPTRILALTVALAALTSGRAQPATPTTPETAPVVLEPLRVTADLWAMPLARIPASVTVYDEAALRAGSVRHFGDLADQIPNLTWTGGTSRPRYLQIRGVGENSQFEGETPDSAVRFLVDDLDFTGLGTIGSAFDVQQVEVLRGPQAGAFGANAAGGVVRLVTNAPTPFWTGRAEAGYGGDSLRTGGFAVGGPLVSAKPEQLMMRVAVQQTNNDGFRRNLTLNEDTNARDEFTARLRLTWNPNELWRWEAAVLAADFENGYDEFALDNNGRYTYSDEPGADTQESYAGSLRGTYRAADGLRFTTVTSGSRNDSRYAYDDDWTAASYMGFSDHTRRRWVVNEELRLDSERDVAAGVSRWTLGAFYSRLDESTRYTNTDPGNVRGLRTVYHSTISALFGQANYLLTPRTRLIAGLRVENISLSGDGIKTRYRAGPGTFDPEVVTRPAFDDVLFGGNYRFFTDNGGDSHVYGLEAAGSYALTKTWSVRASLALMRSELKPFTLANGNTGGGRDLANTPDYGYTLGTRYGADRGFFASAELVGRAEQFDSNNQHEARRAFTVVNATLGYAWGDWTLAFWAKNLFDEVYDKRVYFFGNEDPDYIETRYENRADPRQIGGTVSYRF